MPTLFEQLSLVTEGSSVSVDIVGQVGQFTQIADLVKQLIENPPGDLAGFLGHLQALPLPQLQFGGDLGDGLKDLLPDLQGELGELLPPLLDTLVSIGTNIDSGVAAELSQFLELLGKLRTVFASDFSCGLVAALAPPTVSGSGGGGGGGGAAEPSTPVVSDQQVVATQTAISGLPADMTVPELLKWLHARIGSGHPSRFKFRSIPILDDLRDPLDTLVRWDACSGAQLQDEFAQTLNLIAALIVANSQTVAGSMSAASTTVDAVPFTAMDQAVSDLENALADLLTAVGESNEAAIETALGAAQTALANIESSNATLDGQQAALTAYRQQLKNLPSRLETGICRLMILLQPRATWGELTSRIPFDDMPAVDDDSFNGLHELLERVQEFFENILDLLDVGAVTQPLVDVFDQAGAAIDDLEQGLVQLTASARDQFEQAHTALSSLDFSDVLTEAEQAMQGAATQVQQSLQSGLGAAAAAVGDALTAIDAALNSFDPETLGAPMQQVLDQIAAIFQSGEVRQIVAQLEQLKDLASRVNEISFTPVGDAVIDGVEEVKSALESIDESKLVPPLPAMIQTAASILPQSLTPLTDPLIVSLDDLVEQGPVVLLETVRDLPKPIADQIRRFSPRNLLEEPLNTPFQHLREQLADYQPDFWLDRANQELDALKQRLVNALDLQALLAPLSQVYEALLAELRKFRPGALLEPLTAAVDSAVDSVAGALPTSDFIDGLQQILNQVQRWFGVLDSVNQIVQTFTTRLALLSDPDAQLSAWLDEILAKLPNGAPAALTVNLTAIETAVTNAHAAALRAVYDASTADVRTRLGGLDAKRRLAQLALGKSRLTPALVGALPLSTAKSNLIAWLALFDPTSPTFSRGLGALARMADDLAATDRTLDELFVTWDARYQQADGVLAALTPAEVSVENLRAWLRESLDTQLGRPVIGFLKQLKVIGSMLEAFGQVFEALNTAIQTKLDELLAAPQALLHAAEQLEQLQQRLIDLDLGLFSREVDALYTQLLDQLSVLDPRQLEAPLREQLGEVLNVISLDSVFTPELRQQLRQTYQTLSRKLDGLDPELLVIEPLEKSYEDNILPLVDVLDLSGAVQDVIDKLKQLPEELQTELTRVDEAYQGMLRAIPGGHPGGGGASISVSASVSA